MFYWHSKWNWTPWTYSSTYFQNRRSHGSAKTTSGINMVVHCFHYLLKAMKIMQKSSFWWITHSKCLLSTLKQLQNQLERLKSSNISLKDVPWIVPVPNTQPTPPQYGSLPVSCAGRRVRWLLTCFHALCRNSCRGNSIAVMSNDVMQQIHSMCIANRQLHLWRKFYDAAIEDVEDSNDSNTSSA